METAEAITTGFFMGAVGSLHCIGMCGPLAMALPLGGQTAVGRLSGGLVYNTGRLVTYAWLGLMLGLAGDFVITPALQRVVSLVFGAGILLYLALPLRAKKAAAANNSAQAFFLPVRKALAKLLSTPTPVSLFGIGLLNGLLPCGMIYLALTASFITGSAFDGALFMASFGAGTLPAMLAAAFFGSYMGRQIRLRLRKTIPVFLACMAALLVLRGLNLGIPYISPSLPQAGSVETLCH